MRRVVVAGLAAAQVAVQVEAGLTKAEREAVDQEATMAAVRTVVAEPEAVRLLSHQALA